MIEPHLK